MIIRREQPGDEPAIFEVHRCEFPTDAEAKLVDRLRADGMASVSLVAFVDERIIGHVLLSPVTLTPSPFEAPTGLGLAPVAVLPVHHRKGVGSQLIESGIAECRRMGIDYVVVLGEPEFYRRFGFAKASDRGLDNEYGAEEHFMVIERTQGVLDGVRGLVRYAPAFAEL